MSPPSPSREVFRRVNRGRARAAIWEKVRSPGPGTLDAVPSGPPPPEAGRTRPPFLYLHRRRGPTRELCLSRKGRRGEDVAGSRAPARSRGQGGDAMTVSIEATMDKVRSCPRAAPPGMGGAPAPSPSRPAARPALLLGAWFPQTPPPPGSPAPRASGAPGAGSRGCRRRLHPWPARPARPAPRGACARRRHVVDTSGQPRAPAHASRDPTHRPPSLPGRAGAGGGPAG